MPPKARILVVDDHPVMRRGLTQIVDDIDDMEICGEAASAEEAVAKIEELRPDLTLVDVSLGDDSGIELIKEVKAIQPDAKMLVLSMHDELLFAERAVRAGALGFVNKNQPTDVLIEALHQALSGRVYLSPKMTDRVLHQLTSGGREASEDPIHDLSDRELQVFEMIGQGLITKQIAAKLELSTKTVETYRENIKTKLGLRNGTELTRRAVQWALEQGAS